MTMNQLCQLKAITRELQGIEKTSTEARNQAGSNNLKQQQSLDTCTYYSMPACHVCISGKLEDRLLMQLVEPTCES